jgi:hypothetical protein
MRVRTISVLATSLLIAACGDTSDDRMNTGGLGGAAVGALVGGPVGAIVGGGVGLAGGAALDESADQKVSEFANPPKDKTRQMASTSGATDGGQIWSAAQMQRKLRNDGYSRVYDIRRHGSTYLARGDRDGRAYEIKADAYSGRIIASNDVGRAPHREARGGSTASGLMTEQQVRDALRRNGYEVVAPLDRSPNGYRTQVRQGNESYDVTVDRRSGRIVRATPIQANDTQTGTAAVPR